MREISLYIHVPFCKRRCVYCTFYHVPYRKHLEADFIRALEQEIQKGIQALGESVRIRTVYFGGGTPSVLQLGSLERVFSAYDPCTAVARPVETTFELNPEDVTEHLLHFLKERQVNRVSLGVQSMNSGAQRHLKRCPPQVNERAIEMVQRYFDNVNVDVLLGIPGRSRKALAETIEKICDHRPQHFSVYCLEGGGDICPRAENFFAGVSPVRSAEEYLFACETLREHGYRHYEVSNFALPGFESVHNRVYWSGGEYLGAGPGAHSYIGGRRFYNEPSLGAYLGQTGHARPIQTDESTRGGETRLERMMLALRTDEGMPREWAEGKESLVEEILAEGLGRLRGDRVVLSDRGFLLLDEITLRLSN